jgi:uncharacterized membrane protein
MSETRTTAVAVRTEPERAWLAGTWDVTVDVLGRTGAWAGDTAQKFGALLAALMGPAVFSVYAFVLWSLSANLGWTDTFVFQTGPLSNWLVWMGFAILITVAAGILRRHTRTEIPN